MDERAEQNLQEINASLEMTIAILLGQHLDIYAYHNSNRHAQYNKQNL